MRTIRPRPTRVLSRELVLGIATAASLLAGCDNEFTQEVHQKCAQAQDVPACEQAEYNRLYAIERARNQRIAYP